MQPRLSLAHPRFSELHEHLARCPESMVLPRYGKLSTEIIYEIEDDIHEKCKEFEEARYQLEECRRRVVHVSSTANSEDHIQTTKEDIESIELNLERLQTERRDLWFLYSKFPSSSRSPAVAGRATLTRIPRQGSRELWEDSRTPRPNQVQSQKLP